MEDFSMEDISEALSTSGTGVWRLEVEEGKTPRLYGNHSMNELLGISDETSPEDRFNIFNIRIYEEDVDAFQEYNKALAEEQSEIVYRYKHPEMGTIYVRCGGKKDTTVKEYACFRGFHQNINDTIQIEREKRRRLNEKAIRYQNMSLKLMENFLAAAIYIDLEEDRFEGVAIGGEANVEEGVFSEMCGWFTHYIQEDYREEYKKLTSLQHLRQHFEKEDSFSFSTYATFEDGKMQRRTFWYYAVDDSKRYLLSVSKDTTDDFLKEQALADALIQAKQANRAKTAFLNNMSHDIRTPMNAIIGFTNLAEKYLDDKEKCKDYLSKIMTSSQHLLSLINDVLDMSRIESGRVEIAGEANSLREIVQGLQTILQTNADASGIVFSVNTSFIMDDRVICDKLRLSQILLNCSSNSLKFTPAGGSVTMQVIQLPDAPCGCGTYRFDICDTGIGMSEDFVNQIFEPFSREDNSFVHQVQGTGLGMAITKNIVDLMNGSIEVQSEQGVGTKFSIVLTFPLDQTDNEQQTVTEDGIPLLEGKRLLLVEDNELNREIATEILSETGVTIEIAVNGKEAVDKVVASSDYYYDLVLMDVQMPIMNGYEATEAIRKLDRKDAKALPILAMTANAFEEDRQKALESGMNEHLTKPIDVDKLMLTLTKYMNS